MGVWLCFHSSTRERNRGRETQSVCAILVGVTFHQKSIPALDLVVLVWSTKWAQTAELGVKRDFPSQAGEGHQQKGFAVFSRGLGVPVLQRDYSQAENALSVALLCSLQGLLHCFIPQECGCHSSSQMENPCLRWLWIQPTALGCKPRPFTGLRSWLRARRGEWSSGSFHSRWGTEWGVWPHYSLAGAVLCPLSGDNFSHRVLIIVGFCGKQPELPQWKQPPWLWQMLCRCLGSLPFSHICVKTFQAEQKGYSPFYSYWFAYLEFWILLAWQFKVKKQLLNESNGIKLWNVPCPASVQVNKIITGKYPKLFELPAIQELRVCCTIYKFT